VVDQVKFGQMRRVCPSCGYIHFIDPKVAVVIFIESEGQLLLIKRGIQPEQGKWALPGGYVDYDEDPVQAAIRETAEETGLVVEITRLIDVMKPPDVVTIVIAYAAKVVGGVLCAGDDAEIAAWFTGQNLPELAFQSTQRLVAAWINQ
jgi:8-oxo-dGTP diphosphatase